MIIGGKESRRHGEDEEWKWETRKTWKMKKKEDQESFCEIWYHLISIEYWETCNSTFNQYERKDTSW